MIIDSFFLCCPGGGMRVHVLEGDHLWQLIPGPQLGMQMLVTMIDDDPFVGRIATGRIASGVIRVNDRVKVITRDGAVHSTPSVPVSPLCACITAP